MGDVKLAGVMGLYLGLSVAPGAADRVPAGSWSGIAIIARHGAGGAQEGRPVRAVHGARRRSSALLVGPELIDLYASNFL